MGAYTTIRATINNITKDGFKNFLTNRYHTMVTVSDLLTDGCEVDVFPFTWAFTLEETGNGVKISDMTSAKFMSYEDAMETVPAFFMITDACRQLGDAELVVSPYQDDLGEKTGEDFYRGETFPAKARPCMTVDHTAYEPVKRYMWYYIEKACEKKDESTVVPMEYLEGPRNLYRKLSIFYRNASRGDHRAFYDALLLWTWCIKNGIDGDFADLSVSDFCRFAGEMEKGKISFYTSSALTQCDAEAFRQIFRACGNAPAEAFCKAADTVMRKVDEWVASVEKTRYRISGPDYTWSEDGPVAKATVYKTYGWGFRVFEDISLDVSIDRSGITPASDPKELAEDITRMVFPIFCTVCGYEVREDDVRKAMLMPDEKSAYEALVGAVRRARFNNGLARVLPGYFNGEKMYRNRAALVAAEYVRENMLAEISVPFDEKDKAKAVGAIWDSEGRRWVIARSKLRDCKREWIPAKYL